MARRRGDPLPFLLLTIALDVTGGADPGRDLGVHLNFLRAVGDPQIQLPRAREDRLLMAGVTAERVVLGAGEALERPLHDMTAGAERVVVLHVVPADGAESRSAQQQCRHHREQSDLHPALSRDHPRLDELAPAPHVDEQPGRNRQAEEEAADLNPLREIEEKAQRGGHAARQRWRADGRLLEHSAGSYRDTIRLMAFVLLVPGSGSARRRRTSAGGDGRNAYVASSS